LLTVQKQDEQQKYRRYFLSGPQSTKKAQPTQKQANERQKAKVSHKVNISTGYAGTPNHSSLDIKELGWVCSKHGGESHEILVGIS
jgi:hypothetical protein